MPTSKPRLSITLEPLLALQLSRISELTGNSQSKLITEILEGSTDVFAKLIEVLEAAKVATQEARGKARSDMVAAQARVESQLGLILEDFDRTAAPLLAGVEGVKRRRAKRGALAPAAVEAASPTPISNRGVRSTRKPNRAGSNGSL